MAQGSELRRLLKLAIPVILSQLGNISMGLVDTYVVAKAGSVELSGVAAGNGLFWPIILIAIGLLLGIDTIVSQSFSRKDHKTVAACLGLGLLSSAVISLFFGVIIFALSQNLESLGINRDIALRAEPYLEILAWSTPLLVFFNCFQKYWQACELALPITVLIVFANIVNYFLDEAFVLGKWGFPALGAEGVAYSTLYCRVFLMAAILLISFYFWKKSPRYHRPSLHELKSFDKALARQFYKLSVPAASQIGLEVFAFNIVTIIAATLTPTDLSAHHIVLNIATATFMVPMGISIATSIRVGSHWGARRYHKAAQVSYLGTGLGAAVMLGFAGLLYSLPQELIGIFTKEAEVIKLGTGIIGLCALFQVVDGIQICAGGALRGMGNAKTSLYANTFGHYVIGLPISMFTCFYLDWHLQGLWTGLALGLCIVAVINSLKLRQTNRAHAL